MRAIVLGAKGNLGHQLVLSAQKRGYYVASVDREQLNLADLNAAHRLVRDGHYDLVLNAAAWNDVDGAEDEANRKIVRVINAELPGVLATAAVESGAAFVHYSTDFVFAGDQPDGYSEDDHPDPVSEYGRSKLAGEQGVLAVGGETYVCRTSKLFGPKGDSADAKPSFVSIMMNLAQSKPELGIVDEEVGCPTYTIDLAQATFELVSGSFKPGLYHVVNSGPGVTWYEFAEEFFAITDVSIPRRPVSADQFPRPAARPKFAFLKNTRFPALRPRIEALRDHLKEEAL